MKKMLILRNDENGVSPVIGVMLMLVVTIIIAAVVSGFAGGMMQTKEPAPQASISASYSQYYGLTMTHSAGDSIETRDVRLYIRPSDEFGRGQDLYGELLINQACITDAYGNRWLNANDGTYEVMSWRPGETMYIVGGEDLQNSGILDKPQDWPPCYYSGLQGGAAGGNVDNYCYLDSINNQINIGKTITLEVVQSDGQVIASADMSVEP
ncbi:type IV pilin N-terminal domain-containing protein [Methanolacinia paynteri]|uniref:type IV pilin N-terminal domain-containing protein n=1 Tax=Methanolacinia paynteri TaxID=230356 RepID=UPI0006949175|nr:type IV pilin N-terminal domain-containing protein [Methanolacinia paynteri]